MARALSDGRDGAASSSSWIVVVQHDVLRLDVMLACAVYMLTRFPTKLSTDSDGRAPWEWPAVGAISIPTGECGPYEMMFGA